VTPQELLDVRWDKEFFRVLGLLPATKKVEWYETPTPFTGVGVGAWVPGKGVFRGTGGAVNAYYDLGAAFSKILTVISGVAMTNGNSYIGYKVAPPAAVGSDGYLAFTGAALRQLYKFSGGFTLLSSNNDNENVNGTISSMAFYWDGVAKVFQQFQRIGSGNWHQCDGAAGDATFAALRYVQLGNDGVDTFFGGPVVIYAG